jgi:flagellar biosynthesis protein FlhF
VEVQLVLPATASCKQLAAWIRQSRPVDPKRLIFTHLDEATGPGAMVAAALDARLPISFLATGQAIPEDLESATKSRLLELLLGRPEALGATA